MNNIEWMTGHHEPNPFEVIASEERRLNLGLFSARPESAGRGAPPSWREKIVPLRYGLSRDHAEVLILRYGRSLTFFEIARATQSNEDAVRQMHARAIAHLRTLLASRGIVSGTQI